MTDVAVREPVTHSEEVHGQEMDFASTKALNEHFNPITLAVGLSVLAAFQPEAALAKAGEYGIFEGRIASLAHPAVLASECPIRRE